MTKYQLKKYDDEMMMMMMRWWWSRTQCPQCYRTHPNYPILRPTLHPPCLAGRKLLMSLDPPSRRSQPEQPKLQAGAHQSAHHRQLELPLLPHDPPKARSLPVAPWSNTRRLHGSRMSNRESSPICTSPNPSWSSALPPLAPPTPSLASPQPFPEALSPPNPAWCP